MNELLDFDGIVLAVWGMKPNYNKEKFAVSFDIGIDLIFDLLSFTEYDFEEKTYEPKRLSVEFSKRCFLYVYRFKGLRYLQRMP